MGNAHLYIKIGRFVCPTGFVSECRTAGMPIMWQCQPYATMQHCGHAAYLGRRHLARSVFRPCPTACMRECLHRCVRWEGKEVAGRLQRAAMSYSLSKLRGGRGREGRKEKGGLYGDVCRTVYAWRAAVTASLTFGNSNYGNTPLAAAFTKLRAWPSVCVVLCYLITSFWQIPSGCTAQATPSHNRAKCHCGL